MKNDKKWIPIDNTEERTRHTFSSLLQQQHIRRWAPCGVVNGVLSTRGVTQGAGGRLALVSCRPLLSQVLLGWAPRRFLIALINSGCPKEATAAARHWFSTWPCTDTITAQVVGKDKPSHRQRPHGWRQFSHPPFLPPPPTGKNCLAINWSWAVASCWVQGPGFACS